MFVGGRRVRVAVGGSGVLDRTGVVVGVGGVGEGVAVQAGVVVGGMGVDIAVWVASGVGVRLDGTSWMAVLVGAGVLVMVAVVVVAGWAMACGAVCVGVAVGDRVVGVLQPAFSPPTITSAIRIARHLPGRTICQDPCLIRLPRRSVVAAAPPTGTRRCVAPFLPAATGVPRLAARLAAQQVRRREELVGQRAAACGTARRQRGGADQDLDPSPARVATILIDRHGTCLPFSL